MQFFSYTCLSDLESNGITEHKQVRWKMIPLLNVVVLAMASQTVFEANLLALTLYYKKYSLKSTPMKSV